VVSVAVLSATSGTETQAQQPPPQSPNMMFFVTSIGPGKGGDLGGLEGADRYCHRSWRNGLAPVTRRGGRT
jgi:hypothetical protein